MRRGARVHAGQMWLRHCRGYYRLSTIRRRCRRSESGRFLRALTTRAGALHSFEKLLVVMLAETPCQSGQGIL